MLLTTYIIPACEATGVVKLRATRTTINSSIIRVSQNGVRPFARKKSAGCSAVLHAREKDFRAEINSAPATAGQVIPSSDTMAAREGGNARTHEAHTQLSQNRTTATYIQYEYSNNEAVEPVLRYYSSTAWSNAARRGH